MNPNPEQPDAPYRTTVASYAIVNARGETVATVPVGINYELICAALNAATALHAAGWDAARVFERLPEMLRSLEYYADTLALLTGDDTPADIKAHSELITLLAQLKLKRDTLGGGR